MAKRTGRRTAGKAGGKAATKSKKAGAKPSRRGNVAGKAAGVRGRPFQAGYDPRRNYTKPGSGRPPNEFRHMMGEGVDRATEKVLRALDERDVDDNRFWQALEFAARYSKKRAELEGDEGETKPYVIIAPGPPAGIVKPKTGNDDDD